MQPTILPGCCGCEQAASSTIGLRGLKLQSQPLAFYIRPSVTMPWGEDRNNKYSLTVCSKYYVHTWWCHDMGTLSIVLDLREGNPLLTSGYPSESASNAELWWFFFCQLEQAVAHTVKLSVISDAVMLVCGPQAGRDHFVNAPSQWEMILHYNIVSHWLDAYTKWSLDRFLFCCLLFWLTHLP